jgi:hypothetical protein
MLLSSHAQDLQRRKTSWLSLVEGYPPVPLGYLEHNIPVVDIRPTRRGTSKNGPEIHVGMLIS